MTINVEIKKIPRIPPEIKEFFKERQEMIEERQEVTNQYQELFEPIDVTWHGDYEKINCVENKVLISLVDFDKMRVIVISIDKKEILDCVMP